MSDDRLNQMEREIDAGLRRIGPLLATRALGDAARGRIVDAILADSAALRSTARWTARVRPLLSAAAALLLTIGLWRVITQRSATQDEGARSVAEWLDAAIDSSESASQLCHGSHWQSLSDGADVPDDEFEDPFGGLKDSFDAAEKLMGA